MKPEDVVQAAYEAAFLPEFWPSVCDSLARLTGGDGCLIHSMSPQNRVKSVTSPQLTAVAERFSQSDVRSLLPAKQLAKMPFAFQRDIDLLDEVEFATDPVKNQFLTPIGLTWQMGDVVLEPSGHMFVFDVLRRTEGGPFPEASCHLLDEMKPDLLRAVFMASRVAFQEAKTAAQTLGDVGLPALVLSDVGRVTARNEAMEALEPLISTRSADRVQLIAPQVQVVLDEAIERLAGKPEVQSIPMPAGDDHPPLIINLIPIKRHARDVFSRSAALLVVNQVGSVGPPPLRVLSGLFDLRPGEARIAYDLASGLTLEESARRRSLTLQSARTYLKRVFQKTATGQQSELVSLLLGLGQGSSLHGR